MSARAESPIETQGPVFASPLPVTASASRALSRADLALLGFTIARLILVPIMVASFLVEPWLMIAALGMFVFMDIYDGVLARRYQADGPTRRAVDSTVDRIGIDAVLVAAFAVGALPLWLLVALLMRDAYCAAACAVMMRTRRVAIKADWLYRGLNLSVAAWAASAPWISGAPRTAFASAILVVSLVVATDLTRSVRKVLAAPDEISNRVVRAGSLRTTTIDWQNAISR